MRKKSALSGIRFFLVRFIMMSAVFAPKGSKNAVFGVIHVWVQLILAKLVAPYLLCCIAFATKVQPPPRFGSSAGGFPGETPVINARHAVSSTRLTLGSRLTDRRYIKTKPGRHSYER
ncbi:hypothetical protein CYL20_20175 [Pseudomonas palleroniana]|uniref:Uncharacterized protein n=1 Tax=Pseudomonas palleroniana TaxID=191390 RepID=A0A2L1JE65_9PSED|nr:hypothetical protein CYL20_20175 [Pseudomonas palleroniana]